jgi:hypothetical protein
MVCGLQTVTVFYASVASAVKLGRVKFTYNADTILDFSGFVMHEGRVCSQAYYNY